MAVKASFAWRQGSKHAVRKLVGAARRQGVTLSKCRKDPHGYYITCEAPCAQRSKIAKLRSKNARFSGIWNQAGCDR